MASTTITDAVVFPQDEGTGVADGSESWDSAGFLGLIASHVGGEYKEGMGLSALDTTNETVDVGAGHCFITESGNQVQSGAASASTPDTTLPSGSDMAYLVVFPASTTVSLDADTDASLQVVVDPTASDTVTVEHNTTPTNPSLQIGTADSTAAGNGTSETNDGQSSPGGNGGALRLVETREITTTAPIVDITSNDMLIRFRNVTASSGGDVYSDLSSDGGSSFISSNYRYGGQYGGTGGSGGGGNLSDAVFNWSNIAFSWDATESPLTAEFRLSSALDPNAFTWVETEISYIDGGPNWINVQGSGYLNQSVATDAFRLQGGPNYDGGTVSVYEVID